MLRLIAAFTLAAFTLLVSVDKVCCPDGCTGKSGGDYSFDRVGSSQCYPHLRPVRWR